MKSRPLLRTVFFLSLLFAGGLFLSCAKKGPAGNPNVIKLVSSLPRTGSANAQSTSIVNGIRIAIEEVGAKVGPYEILFEDWDDASPQRGSWDPALEAANADRAIKDPDVMVYIGTFNSGAAKISIPKLNQANLVMVSPANTYPGLTKPGKGEPNEPDIYRPSGRPNFYRVVPADDLQGTRGAEWAKKMGAQSAFIVHDRELYGKGITDVFRARAEEIGLKIAGVEGIDVRASNYKALATKIKAANVDLVYFGGVTQSNAGQFTKDLRASGYKGKLMVPDGCVELAFIQSAGPENVFETYATFGGLPAERAHRQRAPSSSAGTARSSRSSPRRTPRTATRRGACRSTPSRAPARRTGSRSSRRSPRRATSTESSAAGRSIPTATRVSRR